MQYVLKNYTAAGRSLLISGAYLASDMTNDGEQQFLTDVLKCQFAGRSEAATNEVRGLGTSLMYWKQLNEYHIDGNTAAVAYQGNDYRLFAMAIPFECIQTQQKQGSIMRGILNFLSK